MEVKRNDGEGAELIGDRTIPEIVDQYVAAGAPCISVVTGRWFGGDDGMLEQVAALTDLPLLKKDFITREKQIVAAKEMGASAILLTAKILPSKTFQHLIELALANGLTPFVEIVDQAELDSVTHPEDCIIAVNNKDINTHEREPGDIDTSRSLLEATLAAGTPCPVSASAILDPRIAAELVDSGFKGLLIGTGLLRADSIQGWVDEFERHRAALKAPVRRNPPSFAVSQTTTKSIAAHFADQAERRPDAPALIWDGEAISYGELQRMADASFAELEDARLPADRPVGIRAKKSPEAIALILACLRAGRPFLLPSIELASETLAQLFAQAGVSQVISPHGPRSESAASLRALVDGARAEEEAGGVDPSPSGRPRAGPTTSRSCSRPRAPPGCRRSSR